MPAKNFVGAALCFFLLLTITSCKSKKKKDPKPEPKEEISLVQQTTGNPMFLFLSDIHLDATATQVNYGQDAGMDLWSRFLTQVDTILGGTNAPAFIIYTGDLPAHSNCAPPSCQLVPGTTASNENDSNLVTIMTGLRQLAVKYNKPLFYMPGNNDGLTGDYYSFTDKSGNTIFSLVPDASNPYPALNMGKPGSTPSIISLDTAMGYYSAQLMAGLRLICLNTVMYDPQFMTVDGTTAAADQQQQMDWLAAQLADAKNANQKVYIAMHIPPGMDAHKGKPMWISTPVNWQQSFVTLTSNYQATIAGIFYGHTHMDELRRIYNADTSAVAELALCCPGVTPRNGNNPGFKTVTIDATTFEAMDFTTYYTTPTGTGWTGSYSFNSVFGGDATLSIYDRLKAMSLDSVVGYLSQIYTVKNGVGKSKDVKRAVEVW